MLPKLLRDILNSKTIGCGTRTGKLYYLDLTSDSEASLSQAYIIWGVSVEKKTSEIFPILSVTFVNWPRAIVFLFP
ncbi:unnamed protein product [Prunus armeniaca]